MTAPSSNLSNEIESLLIKLWDRAIVLEMGSDYSPAQVNIIKTTDALAALFNKQIVAELQHLSRSVAATHHSPIFGVTNRQIQDRIKELE